jgi:hypothetical protein
MTLRTILLSIQALLTLPEPKDPQDAVVAAQYMNNPDLFKVTRRHVFLTQFDFSVLPPSGLNILPALHRKTRTRYSWNASRNSRTWDWMRFVHLYVSLMAVDLGASHHSAFEQRLVH